MSTVSTGYAKKEACKEISGMIVTVIQAIPYYNDRAKQNEIQKFTPAALEQKVEEDAYSVIVAYAGNRLAGFCLNRFDDYTLWLEWFGVAREFRGQGLANLLLNALEETVAPRSCHKIWCDCRTTNEASIHILIAHGYRQLVTVANHWYGEDFILWEKTV